jgi:tripartite-type tricarboxylate transporter receptor subunit TctC
MKITSAFAKRLHQTLVAVAVGLALAGPALAQDKALVRVLVGFPPGVGTDNLARMYAEALTEALGVTTVVENKPGAGGQIAAQALKQASAESNSLMFAVDHQVVMLPLITKAPGFDVKKHMIPVGRIVNFFTCLAVPASSPVRDLAGYVEAAKKTPEMGNVGIPAPGSQPHFLTYVLAQKYQVDLKAIAYRGAAPAIVDLVGGQIASAIVPCDALVPHRAGGKVRILAIASDKRYTPMPDVPTFGELGFKMPADSFLGVYASASMKPELLRQITEATRKMFDSPRTVEKFASTLMEPAYAGPDELRNIVEKNTEFWGEQVRKSNFQAQ